MSSEARTQLAARQAKLVLALTGNADLPAGFDERRLRVAGAVLVAKRMSAVARAWPGLVEALRGRFGERFTTFAQSIHATALGGALADGRAFVRWLERTEIVPAAIQLHALAIDLQFRETPLGLVPRRGPTVKTLWLSNPRRLVFAMRLPWLGVRWLHLRMQWDYTKPEPLVR